ncbi:hypothetical protein [Paradevosia shaoguanensis]|uniref:hypothetical protein n=1 Tax=Paradevosia shaoguanensis TaxID=1335043 RepID=UPI001933DDF2|nr:hypothetical protein [Paradevosia shaoguanensis]
MTTINTAQYTNAYLLLGNTAASIAKATAAASSSNTGSSSQDAATNITLSSTAQSALATKDLATVVAETRAALTKLLTDAKLTSPLKDGKLALDLSSLDRRALYAVAANTENKFTDDERSAAALELTSRLDAALAGPAAIGRVTGDYASLYKAAVEFLDGASAEEKATDTWARQKAALLEAQKQLTADPTTLPVVDNDPVADYLKRAAGGQTGPSRDFGDIAKDARTALDKQYEDAKAAGKELVFSKFRTKGQQADFSQFDSRSLSAIALNKDEKFSDQEVSAAKAEMRTRSGQALLASFKSASSSTDPTAFATNIIGAYASLSSEEREAAGWSESFYAAAVSNYESSLKLAQMFAQSSGSSSNSSGLGGLAGLLGG